MSIKLMAEIWELGEPRGTELIVLLALADHANEHNECWPSQPRIAQRARISKRQTQRIVQKLVDKGYIEILETGDGRGNATHYRIHAKGDTTMTPFTEDKGRHNDVALSDGLKGDISGERVTSGDIKGDIAMSTESLEPSLEPPINSDDVPEMETKGPATTERDGLWLRKLLLGMGFDYLGDFEKVKLLSMQLEQDYPDEDLSKAAERVWGIHKMKREQKKKGVYSPLAYMQRILSDGDEDESIAPPEPRQPSYAKLKVLS